MSRFKKLNLMLLLGAMLVSVPAFISFIGQDRITASAWNEPQASQEGTYFSSVESETGEALKLKLRNIISSGTNESYDWIRYETADEAIGQSNKVLLIYSRQVVDKSDHVAGSVGWNREHSFAKSLYGDTEPASSDNHHIFADDNQTNSHRGNKPFNELTPGASGVNRSIDSYGQLTDNYYTTAYFMPNDLAKGEVARATMYMNTRYGYDVTLNFYSVELMLEWHLENPVTSREVYRNNTVHNNQGNRNPYIDHEDWACRVYSEYNAATQSLCAGASQPVEPTSVSISPTSASVNLGDTLTLSGQVLPSGASQSLTWESSNTHIATVNNGVVTPVEEGVVSITARSTSHPNISASATITVTDDPIPVTAVSVSPSSVNLTLEDTAQLTATISPSSATNKGLSWYSSNSSVATVSSSGLVSAKGIGSTSITVTTSDGNYTDTSVVTVSELSDPITLNTYSFNSSGHSSWPISSGFFAYYGSGYGVGPSSGYIKSHPVVDHLPVGTSYSIGVAAVTNNASNQALMTLYGLDGQGNRIAGISSSAYTPSNYSGSLSDQQDFARDHIVNLQLPTSMTTKVERFELGFAGASSKTLLVDLTITYTLGNSQVQAQALANLINDGVGLDAEGSCESALLVIENEYNLLSASAQDYFSSASASDFVLARTRYQYLQSWVGENHSLQTRTSNHTQSQSIVAITLIGIIAISSILGYHFLRKNKYRK